MEHVCVRPKWVKFRGLVSQFVKVSLIILSCAELNSAPQSSATTCADSSISYCFPKGTQLICPGNTSSF